MAKGKNKIQLQVLDELCAKALTSINAAYHYLNVMEETEKTRDVSMTKAKLDEALLWLRKHHSALLDALSAK